MHTPHSDVELLVKGMLGGDDDETVIDSSGQDSDAPRDYVRGLAQRATEPYFKQNKAKGPFVVRMRRGRNWLARHAAHKSLPETGRLQRTLQGLLRSPFFTAHAC